MHKIKLAIWVLLFCGLQAAQAQELVIHCINIGQGDCTLVQSPSGVNLMVDSGPPAGQSHLISYLAGIGVDRIDYLISTHYHSDHIGGTDAIVNNGIEIGIAYDRGWNYCSSSYEDYYITAVAGVRQTINEEQVLDLGGEVYCRVAAANGHGLLNPPFIDEGCSGGGTNDENDFSVAMVISFRDFQFYVGGDLSGVTNGTYTDIETSTAPIIGDVEVYQVNHHGSYANSNQYFLDTIDPEVSVISVGENSYGHPHAATMQRLLATSVVYQTGDENGNIVEGDIVIRTTGEHSYTVNGDFYNIGSGEITPVADIQTNYAEYQGQAVTIEGVVTLSAGVLNPFSTDAYIEDNSGMGINIFDLGILETLLRGNKVSISGIVGEYEGITQIFNIVDDQLISQGNELPSGRVYETGNVDDYAFEGTRVWTRGIVMDKQRQGDGWLISIDDGSGICDGLCPDRANVDLSWVENGIDLVLNGVLRIVIAENDTSYSLLVADSDDISIYSDVSDIQADTPTGFALMQNLPNPFNNSTIISYRIAGPDSLPIYVSLEIFNILGQKIGNLINATQSPGQYSNYWDAAGQVSGIYFCRLQVGAQSCIKKMILLK